jgi:hypothetical protein
MDIINKKKDYIPISIKKIIWEKYRHPSNIFIAQCGTCESLIRMPESLLKLVKSHFNMNLNINFAINGVAEFGHIISEYNGGKVTIDNIILQCKSCNTSFGANNIIIRHQDLIMIDAIKDEDYEFERMDIDNVNETCVHSVKDRICKNKPLPKNIYCHIHLK